MDRNIINIGPYRYLVEHYNADTDLSNSQYYAEFIMLRNFTIMNNIIYDNDIYIINKGHFHKYMEEMKNDQLNNGKTIAFPITNSKIYNYSPSYLKFNENYNINSIIDEVENTFGNDVYEIYEIKNKKLYSKKIKCNKFRIYHPNVKNNINAIIDICSYINGIHFHFLCRPMTEYSTNSEKEIKYNNETYSEFVEVYYPNLNDLFKINVDGTYNSFYKEDYNIVASTKNEKFISSILSNSEDLEHSEMIGNSQIVPMNLLIQPYRIVEEYAADSIFNYDENVANDEKIFVKLYLKGNYDSNTNYVSNSITLKIYPYSYIDNHTSMYIGNPDLVASSITINDEFRFNLMSRLGFSNGIISIVSLFDYHNKSYFYNMYKDDHSTSPMKEAYKYYNNVDDDNYMMFINEDIQKELDDIDKIEVLTDEMKQTTKEVANTNYEDDQEILKIWKQIMKATIAEEYEEEFGTPGNFLGFKIEIATDLYFKHIIYNKNVRVNFNDIDDFSFKLNGIFDKWENKPEKLIIRSSFYDRIIGVEIKSNVIIITKEWFKYLINNENVYRLSELSRINKYTEDIDMDVTKLDITNEKNRLNEETIRLNELSASLPDDSEINEIVNSLKNIINNVDSTINDLTENKVKVNFINSIKCIVNKKSENPVVKSDRNPQQIIFKPIFYKVNDLQNIALRDGVKQNIGINLSEYMTKVETFKIILSNKEYIEYGRNDLFVIFNIDANELKDTSGKYNITNEDGTYISSGNWTKY